MKQLYIIGNGFDLFHGLKTNLSDFRDFTKNNFHQQYSSIVDYLGEFFSDPTDWSQLEDMLACTANEDLEQRLSDAIASSETDMGRAAYWHDIQFNASLFREPLDFIKLSLDKWISSINIEDASPNRFIQFEADAIFLNFNYTFTLQKLYGIPNSQILHIHGNQEGKKILGHNQIIWPNNIDFAPQSPDIIGVGDDDWNDDWDDDWRITEAKKILEPIPKLFYKNSSKIIEDNKLFFGKIQHCDEIVFMGWSLGNQDVIYMDEIMSHVSNQTSLYVVYHSKPNEVSKTKKNYQNYFFSHNFSANRVNYYTWEQISELFSNFNPLLEYAINQSEGPS